MARRTRSTDDPRRHRATTGWTKAPAPLSLSSSRPSPPASYAFPCRCVRDAVPVRRSCSSPFLFPSPSPLASVPTLCSFRYVLTVDARRDATVSLFLSRLTLVSNTAQVRYSSRPSRSRIPSLSSPLCFPQISRSFSLNAYFIALLALHFHPRVLRLPSWRFLRLYRGRGSMSLPARRSEYS